MTEPLLHGNYYHIYNRGINSCEIFHEDMNHDYFLHLYLRHIHPIADTYAYALMKNHFHFLIRIKEIDEVTDKEKKSKAVFQNFSNFFNAYTKAFNKKYNRTGSLFEKNLRRKKILTQSYLTTALIYINNNPVSQKIVRKPEDFPWSSYRICLSNEPTFLKRKVVIDWFHDLENFKSRHAEACKHS